MMILTPIRATFVLALTILAACSRSGDEPEQRRPAADTTATDSGAAHGAHEIHGVARNSAGATDVASTGHDAHAATGHGPATAAGPPGGGSGTVDHGAHAADAAAPARGRAEAHAQHAAGAAASGTPAAADHAGHAARPEAHAAGAAEAEHAGHARGAARQAPDRSAGRAPVDVKTVGGVDAEATRKLQALVMALLEDPAVVQRIERDSALARQWRNEAVREGITRPEGG